jgi:YesN/AraC family two-component response regulator
MHVGALIVDDEEDIRTLIKIVILAANQGLFVAGEAVDGHQALERIDEIDPVVVVIDEMMPGKTGVETAKEMLEKRPGQLIIMCTAFLDEDLKRKAQEAGIKLCLGKDDFMHIPDALRAVVTAA